MKDQNTPDKLSILKKTMWQNIILRSKHYIVIAKVWNVTVS